jgi:opacity protein-like surface antigen
MKKLFLVSCLALFAAVANAQIYAGGSFGYTKTTFDDGDQSESSTSYKFIPEVGFHFDDNLAIGATFGYTKGYAGMGSIAFNDLKNTFTTIASTAIDAASATGDVDIKSISISPYLRYRLLKQGMISIYADAFFGYNSVDIDASVSGVSVDDKFTIIEVGLRPVISVALSNNVSLNAKLGMIGYQSGKAKDMDSKIDHIGLDIDSNNITFGAVYAF